MIFCLAVKNVFCFAGCQVGSLPHLPLKAAFVGALHFEIEDRRVSFSLWMVIVEMLCQSITNVFVFNIILVDFLDPVDSRLAGLPVVDGFYFFVLTLRTYSGVICSTACVAAALELRLAEAAVVLSEDAARQVCLHQQSP